MAEKAWQMPIPATKRGLKVMFVAHPDACRVCRSMQGRIFDPSAAPPLPLERCLTPPCRCRYEAYDPRFVITRLLTAGVDAVRERKLEEARELLYQVIDLDEHNEKAWLWLSGVVESIDTRIVCLENVLSINPHHKLAVEGLRYLKAQRREQGAGEKAARKIREARDAINNIRSSRSKVITLREVPPVRVTAPQTLRVDGAVTAPQPVGQSWGAPAVSEGAPGVSFVMIFLSVLLAAMLLILMSAALVSVGSLLR